MLFLPLFVAASLLDLSQEINAQSHYVINRHVSFVNKIDTVQAMRPSRNALLLQALGTTLKERRSELGLTQEDVAGAADIDRPFVTLIESARKQPTISVLWRLAIAMQLTPSDLVARVDARYQLLKRDAGAAQP